jgi:hypothetical protein
MTRTDIVASSRPQAVGAAPMRKGISRGARRLLVLPLALLLAVALVFPTAALAASTGESGYSSTPTAPKSSSTPAKSETTPASGTSPSKEEAPASGVAPAKASSTTAKTLPFTGFDLRWTVGVGVLLVAMGFSIVGVQRRQRSNR